MLAGVWVCLYSVGRWYGVEPAVHLALVLQHGACHLQAPPPQPSQAYKKKYNCRLCWVSKINFTCQLSLLNSSSVPLFLLNWTVYVCTIRIPSLACLQYFNFTYFCVCYYGPSLCTHHLKLLPHPVTRKTPWCLTAVLPTETVQLRGWKQLVAIGTSTDQSCVL